MHSINLTKTKKANNFSRLTFFCSLIIFIIAFANCSSPEDKQEKSEQDIQNLTKTTIPIEGMTCNSCVARIKRKLKSMEALQKVEVSLEHRNATVFYKKGDITPGQIQEAINEIGYEAGDPVTKESKQ
jgi:copper chaperone CopZ